MVGVKRKSKCEISQMERCNSFAMTTHFILALIMSLAYVVEAIKGNRTWGYSLLVVALAVLPPIVEMILFFVVSRESGYIKHILGYGFAVLYTVVLFTAKEQLVFTYVVPMILIISVYNDLKYKLKINIGMVLENIIVVILGAKNGGYGFTDMPAAEIQLMVIVVLAVYSTGMTMVMEVNEKQRLNLIETEKERGEELLTKTVQVSKQMSKDIAAIHEKIQVLNHSTQSTQQAMKQVLKGAADTSEAVSQQLEQTKEIEEKTLGVESALQVIDDNMNQAARVVDCGKKEIHMLVEQVEETVAEGDSATTQLENLDEYISKMHSIVEVIENIADQTGLLALNASIEAARAGESGKGFAVVASEISGMANQTQQATMNIAELINNTSEAIRDVVQVVRRMIQSINDEKELTIRTEGQFVQISEKTIEIDNQLQVLIQHIGQLNMANREIVESIQTISAVSEEVSVHSNVTYESQENNIDTLEQIVLVMERLNELANS